MALKPRDSFEHVLTPVGTVSMTKQSFKDVSDINVIMAKYVRTGVIESVSGRVAKFGDFSNIGDFHSAMNRVSAAQEAFMDLPAKIRDYCRNDPGEFLDLISDSARRSELEALGLVKPLEKALEEPKAAVLASPGSAGPGPVIGGSGAV
ncbi:MAG: internal scaffolding protein [Microviridae sp.]|nr:MAG: internal scaffolding protein [Microviridae sp.]